MEKQHYQGPKGVKTADVSKKISWYDSESTIFTVNYTDGYGERKLSHSYTSLSPVNTPYTRYSLGTMTEFKWYDYLSVVGNRTSTEYMTGSIYLRAR